MVNDRIGSPVSCVVWRSSCRSIMLRQEELAFIKAISTMQLSLAILKELRMAMSRRKKKPAVPVGIRSTISTSGARAPQCLPSLLAGKRKANELACSGDSSEPAIRRPAPDAGSAPLPANSSAVTGEHAASCRRHLVSPEGGENYAAVLPGPSPLISQVGRSSPQPWIQIRLNPLSRPRQSKGAFLATCPGL